MAGDILEDMGIGSTIYNRYYEAVEGSDWGVNQTVVMTTPHTNMTVAQSRDVTGIHPRLYFSYIKSKLSILEEKLFKHRMKRLEQLVDKFAETGQEAMSENCLKMYLVISRECVMWACGYRRFITEEHLDKFRHKVKGSPIIVTPLKNFARVIPDKVANKIKECMKKKLFDEYVVVHIDNKDWNKMTEKEKIEKERDPICFGKVQYSNKYYFIGDWIDEQDNLRLSDIIDVLSLKRGEITLSDTVRGESDERPKS